MTEHFTITLTNDPRILAELLKVLDHLLSVEFCLEEHNFDVSIISDCVYNSRVQVSALLDNNSALFDNNSTLFLPFRGNSLSKQQFDPPPSPSPSSPLNPLPSILPSPFNPPPSSPSFPRKTKRKFPPRLEESIQ